MTSQSPSPPVAAPSEPAQRTLYTTTAVRLRASPSTNSRIISTVQAGRAVTSLGTDGAWHRVRADNETGWMHGDYLSETRPVAKPPPPASPAPAYQPVPLLRRQPAPARRSGEPVRGPYVGTCDCPYDLTRNGQRCGGRSAYSRPGGRSPACYH
ncbi:SH3 domain-containing protein [Pseudochelatococcus sp. B33]